MKRIRNLVIGGIENKIFNLILITVILITAAFTAVTLYQNRTLAQLTEEAGEQQRTAITGATDELMEKVVVQSLDRTAQQEAYIADEMFHGLQTRVELLGTYAEELFTNPQNYQRMPYAAPDSAKDGEIVTQAIFADGVNMSNAAMRSRIGLAANMAVIMESLYDVSAETNSCFIALPEGVFLVTDDRSAAKFDENGEQISYDPRTRPWYIQAVEAGGLIFTDVELDAFTGDIGIVCAMPVYVNGQLKAVVGSDLFLTSMQETIQASEENGGFSCVINQNGHVVFSPKDRGVFRVMSSDMAVDLRTVSNDKLAALIRDAMQAKTDVRIVNLENGANYMIGVPMETVGWVMVAAFSRDMAMQPGIMMRKELARIETEAATTYREKSSRSRHTIIALLFALTILMLAGALTLGKRIVKPLNTITKKIASLSERDLEFKMEDAYRTGDEIEVLAESFASVSHRTVEYIGQVQRVTAEKERIGTELEMATRIQTAMLPHIFPAFPDRPELDIYASMDPAKEVGGDFYDYFLVDDDHLCMVIADVSGKGVPAALFMMASKIIIQSIAMLGSSPAEILKRTNDAICSNNEEEMFVTVWLGIVDLSTGRVTAANAGHEYPVLKEPGGIFEILKDRHDFVIGGMEGLRYNEYELQLTPGGKLFVYTDGVPEATNADKEQFGTERMVSALNVDPAAAPEQLLANVRGAVNDFVQDAEQFDDLTMLCIEYKGR